MRPYQQFAEIELERHVLQKKCMHRKLEGKSLRGVYRGQLPLLSVLWVNGPHSQAELAGILHISPASIAVSLRRLEAGGFVRRLPVPGNLRANRVELTQKGAKAAFRAQEILLETTVCMLEGFSQQECEQALAYCSRMRDNLKRYYQNLQETEESD